MLRPKVIIGIVCCIQGFMLGAQPVSYLNFPVTENQKELSNPFAGGLNEAQFSTIDLNRDGQQDLWIFDRSGQVALPFMNTDRGYIFAPEYQAAFPPLSNWALLRDYNGDGRVDIFSHAPEEEGIRVFTQQPTDDLAFQLDVPLILPTGDTPLFVPATDIPAIGDLEGDGDLDILVFDAIGSFVNWFQNQSVEQSGIAGLFPFELADPCWGRFREEGLDNRVFLDQPCNPANFQIRTAQHAGSTLTLLPHKGDSLLNLILGDISHENMVFLQNEGTPQLARIDSSSARFPNDSNPVNLFFFPAAFFLDVTHDGQKDLLVAPNAPGVSDNFHNIWLYEGKDSDQGPEFQLLQKNFLQESMIDCGANSHPILWDYNNDGLQDILIGNKAYQTAGTIQSASLTLYENTGTPSAPRFTLTSRDLIPLDNLFSQPIQEIRPTVGDLDNDGDQDLILGDINGHLHLLTNETEGDGLRFELTGFRFSGIDVGQNASPQLVDVNQDGLLDLLVGELSGVLNFFPNTGTPENPQFSAEPDSDFWGGIDVNPECCTGLSVPHLYTTAAGNMNLLVGAENGEVFLYESIRPEADSPFVLSPGYPRGMKIGSRMSPFAGDLDNDDSPEWLIGNARGGLSIIQPASDGIVSSSHSLDAPSVILSPNPSNYGHFGLNFAGPKWRNPTLTLYSLEGKRIAQKQYSGSPTHWEVHFNNLNPGTYFVQLTDAALQSVYLRWVYLP